MRTIILAGLAVITLSACGSNTQPQPAPTSPSSAAATGAAAATSAPAATISDYARPVTTVEPDLTTSVAKLHAECDATAGADPLCPLDAFDVATSAQILGDGLSGLASDIGPPPSEIADLVSDTVTAAGQVETDGIAFYHQQTTWMQLNHSLTTLATQLAKWAPYGG